MSAYDRAITVFSPDGHLLQVQYASEAVNRGMCAVGVRGKDLVVLAVERRVAAKLQDPRTAKKIEVVDDGAAIAVAGLSADGRALVARARVECQSYRLSADEAPSADYISQYIARLQQRFTMRGGMRPFGVACLVAGFSPDGQAALFKTESHGILTRWKAHAIGRNHKTVTEFLEKSYKEDLEREAAIKLALAGLTQVADLGNLNLDVAVVERDPLDPERFTVTNLTEAQLQQFVNQTAAAAAASASDDRANPASAAPVPAEA